MGEENIIYEDIDVANEYENIEVVDSVPEVDVTETIDVIEVEDVEITEIGLDEAFSALGENNELLRHSLLHERELHDQHPIMAITGLRQELDNIEALQVVYSNEKGFATYYMWEDENSLQEIRTGSFVTICEDRNKIRICTENDDVLGVIVDAAAFIGGQDDIVRDYKYGLVVNSGVVAVRCELPVDVGDCVISNNYGFAQRSSDNCGYKVSALENINGVIYAIITLNIPVNSVRSLSSRIDNFDVRMGNAEKNIISAINVATEAYHKANEVDEVSEEAIKNALEALGKANEVVDQTAQLESSITSANEAAMQARAIAESAAVSAESIRQEAVKTANEATSNVNDLIKELEPLTTWETEYGTGAEYLAQYIKDGLATKVEVQTVETMTENNKSAIETNAESFQTLVSSIDKYSVGEYSQAYGLTREQATSILKVGMIYIPTEHTKGKSHSETYVYIDEEGSEQKLIQEFTPGYYYTWDGDKWIESVSPLVTFATDVPVGSSVLEYWYLDAETAPDGYEAHALYIWKDEQWEKVNILDGNVNNRLTSIIKQTADGVALEVTNARGDAATLGARLKDTESEVQSLVSWATDPDGNQYNLATIKQTADDAGASIAQVVKSVGANGEVTSASIIQAINNDKSSILLEADHINITGALTANGNAGFTTDGNLFAKGGTIGGWNITTSYIDAFEGERNNYTSRFYLASATDPSPYYVFAGGMNSAGTAFERKFSITKEGDIYASSGIIAGWNIGPASTGYSSGLHRDVTTDDGVKLRVGLKAETTSTALAFYVREFVNKTETNPSGDTRFYVNYAGKLYATNAEITGKITASSGKIGGWSIGGNYLRNIRYDSSSNTSWNAFMQVPTSQTSNVFAVMRATGEYSEASTGVSWTPVFRVNAQGQLYATGATIKGNITASGGLIGGFDVDETKLIQSTTETKNGVTTSTSTTVEPGIIELAQTVTMDNGFSDKRITRLTDGLLKISLNASEMMAYPTIMSVTLQGTTYSVYIDPNSNTLKVRTD